MNTLRDHADKQQLDIGTCVHYETWANDPDYRDLIPRHFNRLTPENCLSWEFIHPQPNKYDFTNPDALIKFAKKHDMNITGIPLTWHMENPDWLQTTPPQDLKQQLQAHIKTTVSRYATDIDTWTVVNEPINDNGNLRKNIWLKKLGKSYIENAFKWANRYTDATLLYNDYGLPYNEAKRERAISLIKTLLENNTPIDGVGIQMHFIGIHPTQQQIRNTIQQFQDLGVDVYMTELDIAYDKENPPKNIQTEQAEYYQRIFETVLDTGIDHLSLWGARDTDSWINHCEGYIDTYTDTPLLLDKHGDQKKEYNAVQKALTRNK